MFPFTQISNLYTYIFYNKSECGNCGQVLYSPVNNMIATHCSIGCGYADYNKTIEREKKKKEEEEKHEQEKIKNDILEQVKKEELENMKKEIMEEIRAQVKQDLQKNKDIILNELLN